MGSGIAQVAATAGRKVMIYDKNLDALIQSQQKLAEVLDRLIEKNRIDKKEKTRILNNIKHCQSLQGLATADLVIEAVIEDGNIKKQLFEKLEVIVSKKCIIASNTSSLSITSLAASIETSNRFIGVHFFNPAPLMKLVEIIPAIQTDQEVIQRATKEIQEWSKLTVLAKDTPGFIVNKVARPFYGEAIRMYEEGVADFATIDWAMTAVGGFRMGPFQLMDFIGHDVNYKVTETVFEAFYYDPRYKPSFTQKRLTEAGYLGKKSGKGFYDYRAGATHPLPHEDKDLAKQIVDRIIVMLINEAADTLHTNIATIADIDTAMAQGVNYPKGLFQWADEIGISNCVKRLDALYEEYHEDRYRCCSLLRKMARDGVMFYS